MGGKSAAVFFELNQQRRHRFHEKIKGRCSLYAYEGGENPLDDWKGVVGPAFKGRCGVMLQSP